jgi:hypothetical protein
METNVDHSTALFHGGIRGLIWGAVIGAIVAIIGSVVADFVFRWGTGGPGLSVMGGVTFGAIIGWFAGILRYRRTGRGAQG